METSETTGAIAAALAKAHLEIENPELDGVNPHFKSRFSTLAAVLNAVRKPLAKQGIALMQSVSIAEGRVAVTTSLIHASGEWMRETMAFPMATGANIQQAGSTVSYLRRYSIISLTAIVGDPHADDDGEGDRIEREDRKPTPPKRQPFKPDAAKGAPPAASAPAAPAPSGNPIDDYPDDFDGLLRIKRVTRREKAWAVLVESKEHGLAWVKTNIEDYANALSEAVGQDRILGLFRNGPALEITHMKLPPQAEKPAPAPAREKEDADALPF
jgi:hypothetical protein